MTATHAAICCENINWVVASRPVSEQVCSLVLHRKNVWVPPTRPAVMRLTRCGLAYIQSGCSKCLWMLCRGRWALISLHLDSLVIYFGIVTSILKRVIYAQWRFITTILSSSRRSALLPSQCNCNCNRYKTCNQTLRAVHFKPISAQNLQAEQGNLTLICLSSFVVRSWSPLQ